MVGKMGKPGEVWDYLLCFQNSKSMPFETGKINCYMVWETENLSLTLSHFKGLVTC